MGSSIDDFLKEEDIFDEAQAQAVQETLAWQPAEALRKKKYQRRAKRRCAAAMVGRRVTIELV
jgi:hypothetical protein